MCIPAGSKFDTVAVDECQRTVIFIFQRFHGDLIYFIILIQFQFYQIIILIIIILKLAEAHFLAIVFDHYIACQRIGIFF